jgi:hypothetical protein
MFWGIFRSPIFLFPALQVNWAGSGPGNPHCGRKNRRDAMLSPPSGCSGTQVRPVRLACASAIFSRASPCGMSCYSMLTIPPLKNLQQGIAT